MIRKITIVGLLVLGAVGAALSTAPGPGCRQKPIGQIGCIDTGCKLDPDVPMFCDPPACPCSPQMTGVLGPFIEMICEKMLEEEPPFAGTSTPITYQGGPWTIGNQYGMTLTAQSGFAVRYHGVWGESEQTVQLQTANIMLGITNSPNATEREIVVTFFHASIPSFVHPVTAPGMTGTTNLDLQPNVWGGGTINTTTGNFQFTVPAVLTNDYYLPGSNQPVYVHLFVEGNFNPYTQAVTLNVSPDSYATIASIPE